MKRADQRLLLRTFCNRVRDAMLARSDRWPEDWDGHELRELAAYAFQFERTRLMLEARSRRRQAANAILVNNLY